MRKMRQFARATIWAEAMTGVLWIAAVTLAGGIGVAYLLISGEFAQALDLGVRVCAGVAVLGFLLWVAVDSPRQVARIREERIDITGGGMATSDSLARGLAEDL
jgi:hypothetical protein